MLQTLKNAFTISFYSSEFYHGVYTKLKGLKLAYLFLAILITKLTVMVPVYSFVQELLNNEHALITQIPAMKVTKGKLEVIGHFGPVNITFKKNTLVIIDPNNSGTAINAPFFVNASGVYIQGSDNKQMQILKFSSYSNADMSMSKDDVKKFVSLLKTKLFVVIMLVIYPIVSFIKLLLVSFNLTVFSSLIVLFGMFTSSKRPFIAIFRVAVFATIPPLLIDGVLNVYFLFARPDFFLYAKALLSTAKLNFIFFISLVYLVFALRGALVGKTK